MKNQKNLLIQNKDELSIIDSFKSSITKLSDKNKGSLETIELFIITRFEEIGGCTVDAAWVGRKLAAYFSNN
jgi:hypothetical protein